MVITLTDGAAVDSAEIVFDSATYHFYFGDLDITDFIARKDKLRLVPGFDVERENYRLSQERPVSGGSSGLGVQPLNDSTWHHFGNQIVNDPLGAPVESLDKAVQRVVSSSGVRTLVIAGALGLAVLIYLKK